MITSARATSALASRANHASISALRQLARHALELALPRACVACSRLMPASDRGVVCGACWSRVALLSSPRCERCGHPLRCRAEAMRCSWCATLPAYVRAARSVCWMPGGTAGAIVRALKYHGWDSVADSMAERIARLDWPADVVAERTALVPVPLASARLRERGFNQSALIARSLGARWHIPVWETCLVRVRATRTQTRLTPEERRRNVAGAFRAEPGAIPTSPSLRGTHLVLVDDVMTTGATLAQCAETLFGAGARIVSYVSFARAPAAGDRA